MHFYVTHFEVTTSFLSVFQRQFLGVRNSTVTTSSLQRDTHLLNTLTCLLRWCLWEFGSSRRSTRPGRPRPSTPAGWRPARCVASCRARSQSRRTSADAPGTPIQPSRRAHTRQAHSRTNWGTSCLYYATDVQLIIHMYVSISMADDWTFSNGKHRQLCVHIHSEVH